MKPEIKIFNNPLEIAVNSARILAENINGSNQNYYAALSGGSTPGILFDYLNDEFRNKINWSKIHFFWGDERCVPPGDPESNFGNAERRLLKNINIPPGNIHRIRGENDPEAEALRYAGEIQTTLPEKNGLPSFSLVFLGMGDDGHTASIFPGQIHLVGSSRICETAFHPESRQKRITLTGRVINNADYVLFLVTGSSKAEIVKDIFINGNKNYPASKIEPVHGKIIWYLDKEAASLLS